MADQSTSMPKEFRGGDSAMDQLVARITETATKIHPAAKVTYILNGSTRLSLS